MQLSGFTCKDEAVNTTLADWWDVQDVDADAEEIAKSVGVTSEGFIIAEQREDGTTHVYANPSHLCAMFYREDDPKTREFAAKWYESGDVTYLTLYYPDHFEHYVARQKRTEISGANAFAPDPEVPEETNPHSEIPVFHYRRDRRGTGELTNVVPLQNALNKLFADMMVAAEYSAFKQRYVLTNAELAKGDIKNAPNEIWKLPAGDGEGPDTKVGEFEATQLKNFIDALDHIAIRIAVLTRTPKHYLLQASDVSGEALLAMEAPLVKKATKCRRRLEVTWKQAVAFILRMQGSAVDADDIECIWEDEHTVQPYTEALILKTLVDAGIPLETMLRRTGWSEEEIAKLLEDAAAESERGNSLADSLLDKARRDFDGGRPGQPYRSNEAPKPPVPEISA